MSTTGSGRWIALSIGAALAAARRTIFKPLAVRSFTVDFDAVYGFAWFTGFAVAMVLYYLLMVGRARPAPEVRDVRNGSAYRCRLPPC